MYLDANFRSLRVSGTTAEGSLVIAGLFPVVNSEGVALDMLLELFHDRRWCVDWFDFLLAARGFGWNLRTTLGKIHTAVEAVEGPGYAAAWLRGAEGLLPTLMRVRVVAPGA
jgi:hypothetical protein